MKNLIILLIVLIGTSITTYSQNKYDFSKVKSESEFNELLTKIEKENDFKIDLTSYTKIKINGMHYAGVPLITAVVSKNYMKIIADTIAHAAKNFLQTIEAEKGVTKPFHGYDGEIDFKWNTETEDAELSILLINGKDINSLGDLDMAWLDTRFKPHYDVPLANIHKEIKTFDEQPIYALKLGAYHCIYDIKINDITLAESMDLDYIELYLNDYITDKLSSLKIIFKPRPNKDGQTLKKFRDGAYFSINIIDKNTGKSVKKIDQTTLKGSNPIEFKLAFNSTLPYYPKAWTDGIDLRNDKNLKDKIIALYDKLGKAVLAKDEQTINDMLYQRNFELQQLHYDANFETARKDWERLLKIQNNSNNYTITQNFDFVFYANGKLIYVYPKKENGHSMLYFDDRPYTYYMEMNYMLYQPEGTDELKIVR